MGSTPSPVLAEIFTEAVKVTVFWLQTQGLVQYIDEGIIIKLLEENLQTFFEHPNSHYSYIEVTM